MHGKQVKLFHHLTRIGTTKTYTDRSESIRGARCVFISMFVLRYLPPWFQDALWGLMAVIVAAAIPMTIIVAAIQVAIIAAAIRSIMAAPTEGGISSAGPTIITTMIGTPTGGEILSHTSRKCIQTEFVA